MRQLSAEWRLRRGGNISNDRQHGSPSLRHIGSAVAPTISQTDLAPLAAAAEEVKCADSSAAHNHQRKTRERCNAVTEQPTAPQEQHGRSGAFAVLGDRPQKADKTREDKPSAAARTEMQEQH